MPIVCYTLEIRKHYLVSDRVISKVKGILKRFKKMAKKLFVGNLSYNLTDEQLNAIFAPFGTIISANIVFDKFSHRSKGFGFVEFETEEMAQAALSLDGNEQDGRNIAVKEALPRPERPQM